MVLSEANPHKLYAATMVNPFYYNHNKNIWINVSEKNPIDFILLILSNNSDQFQQLVTYEIIAGSTNILFASLSINQIIEEVNFLDLPLYIPMKYKAPNFDRILKGDTPESSKSFYSTITFRSLSPAIPSVK